MAFMIFYHRMYLLVFSNIFKLNNNLFVFSRTGIKRTTGKYNWIWMDVIRNGYVEFLIRTTSIFTTQSTDKRREKSKINTIYNWLNNIIDEI